MTLLPDDPHDAELRRQAAPADWCNPRPSGRYNLVAIGGGTAGIIAALGTAALGGKAALIESRLLGGDCLNFGCVPSKALLRSAKALSEIRHAAELGIQASADADFANVMARLRRLRAQISHHDSAARFRDLGVDVFLGQARFTGPASLEVAGERLEFARAVVATGGRPAVPEIPGINEVGYLTNETVFALTELPQRLVIIGGGPIGCELAQAFCRLGSTVDLVQRGAGLLSKEDPAVGSLLAQQFEREGIRLHLGWHPSEAAQTGDRKSLVIEHNGKRKTLDCDAILVAAGRRPNVEELGLDQAGVKVGAQGVVVDDFLRSSNRRIYAAGDVCSAQQFTHAAEAMAKLAIQNALFFGRKRVSRLLIPRVTYTDPEIAQVGLTEAEAGQQGVAVDRYEVPLADVDRAVLDGETQGYAAILTAPGTGRVVGATIVAKHAGELLSTITLAMQRKVPLSALADLIFPYPTQAEVWRRVANAYQRTRLTPTAARWLERWLRWRR